MRHLTIYLLAILVLTSCGLKQSDSSANSNRIDSLKIDKAQSNDWLTLKKYIGTFPKETDFFKNPIVTNELKRILGSDYKLYLDHVSQSGCGSMISKDNLIVGDISQLHVGGYGSIVFIDIANKKMYLFWLSSTVSDKIYKIYGDKPIPNTILRLIVDNMNEGWGHVAHFTVDSDSVKIEIK
jgi:hypothetical protein